MVKDQVIKRIALIASAAIAAITACQKNEVPDPEPEAITLYATMEEVLVAVSCSI